jgi:peptidoglycan/LPS O-acetylase OafA/YrhL
VKLHNLRRITRDGNYIPEIDGLRFVAIVSVVLYHSMQEPLHRSRIPQTVEPRYESLVYLLNHGGDGKYSFSL